MPFQLNKFHNDPRLLNFITYSDYMTVDNDFWDEEFGERKRRRTEKSGSERRRNIGRENLLQRYKVMQVRLQDRNGNFFTIKKKVR